VVNGFAAGSVFRGGDTSHVAASAIRTCSHELHYFRLDRDTYLAIGRGDFFVGLPGIVIVTGCAALLQNWERDQILRHDVRVAIESLRRHSLLGVLTAAVLFAGTILTVVISHHATD
jgi:hypothetical protein